MINQAYLLLISINVYGLREFLAPKAIIRGWQPQPSDYFNLGLPIPKNAKRDALNFALRHLSR
jgi:hypothetical protein